MVSLIGGSIPYSKRVKLALSEGGDWDRCAKDEKADDPRLGLDLLVYAGEAMAPKELRE